MTTPIDPQGPPIPDKGLGLRDLFGILRRRWWLLALGILGVPLAVAAYCFLATPRYTAQASILMETEGISAGVFTSELVTATRKDIFSRAQFYATERELISSEANLVRVTTQDALWDRCGLEGEERIEALKGHLEVEGAPQSKITFVKVEHEDADCAADLSNAVASAYVQANWERSKQKFADDVDRLVPEVDRLRDELNVSLMANEEFKREHGLIAPLDAPLADDQKRLTDLRAQLDQAKVRRIAIQKQFEAARSFSDDPTLTESLPAAIADPVVSRLRASYLTLLSEYADLSQRYRAKHPRMQRVQAQLGELEQSLRAEVARVVNGLEIQYRIALDSERALDREVGVLEEAILVKSEETFEAGLLADEARSRRAMVDGLIDKIAEASIVANIKQNNVSFVDPATAPREPSFPATGLFLAIALGAGVVLGLTLAFLSEALDTRVREPRDLDALSDIPFATAVPWARLAGGNVPPPSDAFQSAVAWLEAERAGAPQGANRCQIVTVAGLSGGEGACTTAAGIAVGEAAAGRRVLVVDARAGGPGPSRLLGGEAGHVGLAEWMTGRTPQEGVLQRGSTPNVDLVTAGAESNGAHHLMRSDRVAEAFASIAPSYDLVLIDAPPLLESAVTQILARNSDLLLVVVAANRTRHEDIAAASRALAASGPIKARALLNGYRA